MRFNASSPYDYYRPDKCGKRVALRHRGVTELPPTAFDELLARLGREHERNHLRELPTAVDFSGLEAEKRERETIAAIRSAAAVIYQGRFRSTIDLEGEACEVIGEPDYLLRDGNAYVIRDAKLSFRIDEENHPEILRQLDIYGLLYERATGQAPAALEAYSGRGEIVRFRYLGDKAAISFLSQLRRMRLAPDDLYEPVGWSKCGSCGFFSYCWPRALASSDVSLLQPVSQDMARKLQAGGVLSFHNIEAAVDNPALADVFYEKPKKKTGERKLREKIPKVLRAARVMASGRDEVIAVPDLPEAADCVMLDLEGLPPHLGEDLLERIYLWGLKDFRATPPRYLPAAGGFGPAGDEEGWRLFLVNAADLMAERPGLRFVHYHHYEKTKIDLYLKRFGDPTGVAAQVLERLFDLFPAVKNSVVLPISSYGLKVVEKHVGFERKLAEARGDWAMARYIEAVETSDHGVRDQLMSEILAYNEEDLDATQAVLEWLRSRLRAS